MKGTLADKRLSNFFFLRSGSGVGIARRHRRRSFSLVFPIGDGDDSVLIVLVILLIIVPCFQLCASAQEWANLLAHTNSFRYRNQKDVGENLYSRPLLHPLGDLTGKEVAVYWYSTIRKYDFSKKPDLLHIQAGEILFVFRLYGPGEDRATIGVGVERICCFWNDSSSEEREEKRPRQLFAISRVAVTSV